MPLQETSGAASYDAFGGGVPFEPTYIEQIFSTFLYNGTATAQTINNGVDLAGKGGLVWIKTRTPAIGNYHALFDTVRGNASVLSSNATDAANAYGTPNVFASFNSNGFSLNATDNYGWVNSSGISQVSWTFRKQAKFFDVVTWTGNGVVGRSIAHNLGSAPGCVIVKCTSAGGSFYGWEVWHRDVSNQHGSLDSTSEFKTGILNGVTAAEAFGNGSVVVPPTSTVFTVGGYAPTNENGRTYVAYIFAHDAGGFGLSGTDNVISCGSYTGNGSATGPVVTLGYESQWLLVKNASDVREWFLMDSMRGFTAGGNNAMLFPNASSAESNQTKIGVTATGFQPLSASGDVNASGNTYIYIAIRRGPMKVPTTGTSVFAPKVRTGTASDTTVGNFGFPIDLVTSLFRAYPEDVWFDRLRGATRQIKSTATSAESIEGASIYGFDVMDGYNVGIDNVTNMTNGNTTASGYVNYAFRRAPGFFDVVCYTGTGVARTINHNLAAVPELMIVKKRSGGLARGWFVYSSPLTAAYYTVVNTAAATVNGGTFPWNNTVPTSSVFSVSNDDEVNGASNTYVAYLFATVAGVSKVGSYTGTGTTNQINCGFTTGARFVLIKRTNSTGDWYVWDSARGIVAGNDPYLLLNSTAAEVTSTDYVDTAATGFEISSTAPAAINANGGNFIFLAIS